MKNKLKIIDLIKYLIIFSVFFAVKISYAQEANDVKGLIAAIDALADDTSKVDAYNDLLWELASYDSINSVIVAQKSIDLAEKLEYYKGIATAQKNLGKYYYYTADYIIALDLYEKSLENYQKSEYKKGIAIGYKNVGNIYSQIGSTEKSLSYFLKSLEIREEIKDTAGVAMVYEAIGKLYSQISEFEDSAIVYYNKALLVYNVLEDYYNITSSYINIGSFYYNQAIKTSDVAKKDSAVFYSRKALELSHELQIKRFEGLAYEILGGCYSIVEEGKDSALYFYNKSLEVRKEDGNTFGVLNSLYRIGIYYYDKLDYYNAETYLEEAKNLSIDLNTWQVSMDIFDVLKDLFYKTGRYKQAYDAFSEYLKFKDSLQNDENIKKLTQLSMQYEFDKKQKLQELEQQKKDAIKEAQLRRQKLLSTFFILGFLVMLGFAFVIFRSYKQKKKNNKLLQEKNDQITLKNAQLNQSNEEIEAQKEEIERQKEFLEKQNKEITSSINYARRIQQAVITPISFFENYFSEYFVLYKPRDIVSGDFFWGTKIENKLYVTAADCTGHGVPGAFMSMLGISFLNQIVKQNQVNNRESISAAYILDELRAMIISSLAHSEGEEQHQEGMDMTLLIIDKEKQKLDLAGAYNPLVIIRNDEVIVHKVDKIPVGYHFVKIDEGFESFEIDYEPEDKLYIFSDGFQDQFGGPDGRKVTPKLFKNVLFENRNLPMEKQKIELDKFFYNWLHTETKEYRQIDDVLVMGLKL